MLANASKNLMDSLRFRRLLSGRADYLRRSAGLLNFLQSRLREMVGFHRDLFGQHTVAEHFQPFAEFLHQPDLAQAVDREGVAVRLFQLDEVDDGELFLEDIGESS